jgi:hypothetical protein
VILSDGNPLWLYGEIQRVKAYFLWSEWRYFQSVGIVPAGSPREYPGALYFWTEAERRMIGPLAYQLAQGGCCSPEHYWHQAKQMYVKVLASIPVTK